MKIKNKINVFFDIDDVLFPSTQFARLARENALKAMIKWGLNQPYEKLESKLNEIIITKGSNHQKHFDFLLKELHIRKEKHAQLVAAAIGAYHDTKTTIQPYPDVQQTLLTLWKKYPLYIASDGVAVKQWDKLIRMNLAIFFERAFISEELKIKKCTGFYKKIAQLVKANEAKCIMIGDREDKDIVPAKKAGWFTIRIQRKGTKHFESKSVADKKISSFTELVKILNTF